ncbi:tannase/feruloyl esterase family alpha/beta hydrolase [Kibdelosporangium lantanae]
MTGVSRRLATLALVTVTAGLVITPGAAYADAAIHPVASCADLVRTYDTPSAPTHVTAATVVPAAGVDPEYCHVTGYVEPAVHIDLKLPTNTFTGRYVQNGCGGFCGVLQPGAFPDCGRPAAGDFAVAATDDGHVGTGAFPTGDGSWAANSQPARDDFDYRAPHEVSVASKRIIAAFYGTGPKHSYFRGCSNGGREGLLLAQRYPDDFDGIIAGAPAGYFFPLVVFETWLVRSNTAADGSQIVTAPKLPLLHNAVVAACDTLDGLADGQIEDPRACAYDPGLLLCPGADAPTCLTPAQVEAVRKFYAGPSDPYGVRLYPGGEPRGSELAWGSWILPIPGLGSIANMLGDGYLKYQAYPIGTPHSSVADFQFTLPEFAKLTVEGYRADAMSLDLSRFERRGGKLIIYHGGYDQAIPPSGTVDYYQRLAQRSGGLLRTQQWARLFVVPGMYHCGGGDSLAMVDPTRELVAWVENGNAPDRITATGVQPRTTVTRTRPVFPYPLRAKYTGTGDVNDAANFAAAPTIVPPDHDIVTWAGVYLHHIPGPTVR